MAVDSIKERYKYMMLMYGCLASAESSGNTCFDPLLFHYPQINATFENIESTFMFADAIKVSPVLETQGSSKTFKSFFPAGKWVSMTDYTTMEVSDNMEVDLPFPESTVHAHLRPGYMVAIQEDISDVMTAADLKNKDYSVVVNRGPQGKATGSIWMDDGSDMLAADTEEYTLNLQKNQINVFKARDNQKDLGRKMKRIIIGNAADLQDIDFACYMNLDPDNTGLTALTIAKDADKGVVMLSADGGISLAQAQFFSFGKDGEDINICKQGGANYQWKDAKVDLSGQ